ncbi:MULTISPECIES: extensin family protein [unclassified Ensifer]|uniref:extensin family protein n=1 Tax=unclassified Ensifer TaxID=2633371 RepID=UPI0009F45E7D|nr:MULTISPECIES: extensin family protein [unclassified Ensifer]
MRCHIPLIFLSTLLLTGASLPKTGPLPSSKPPADAQAEAPIPAPEKKPETPVKEGDENKNQPPPGGEQDGQAPTPEPKPTEGTEGEKAGDNGADGMKDDDAEEEKNKDKSADDKADQAPVTYPPVENENPAEYAKCLSELKALGAVFAEARRIDDGKGCGIDKPLDVESVLPEVKLAPKGLMRCEAALALARWTKETVQPAADVAFAKGTTVKTLNQASTYICRLRNNGATGKISEHAHGNAVDIASFTLSDGKTIEIQPRDEDGTMTGAFQRAITASACLYFKTVLDPGSDAVHETHLHLDVIERGNGYRYCR